MATAEAAELDPQLISDLKELSQLLCKGTDRTEQVLWKLNFDGRNEARGWLLDGFFESTMVCLRMTMQTVIEAKARLSSIYTQEDLDMLHAMGYVPQRGSKL